SPGRSWTRATTSSPSASGQRCSSPRCGSSAAPRRKAPSCSICSPLPLAAATAANDQLVRFLVLAPGALAERRDAPRRDRVPPALRLALAAAVRMVDRVHRRAAHGRALAEPPAAAGLPDRDVRVVGVPDLTDRRAAGQQYPAHPTPRPA